MCAIETTSEGNRAYALVALNPKVQVPFWMPRLPTLRNSGGDARLVRREHGFSEAAEKPEGFVAYQM